MCKKNKEKRDYSVSETVLRLVKDLKPISGYLVFISFACALSVALGVLAPKYVGDMTDVMYAYGTSGFMDYGFLSVTAVKLVIVYVLSAVLSTVTVAVMQHIGSRYYTYEMRSRISKKLIRLPVSYIDGTANGELLSRMMDDVSGMSGSISVIIETVINGVLRIIAISVALFLIHPAMAIAVIVFVPISVILSAFISKKSEDSWHAFREVNGKFKAFVEEDYSGFDTVKAFNMEERQKRIGRALTDVYAEKQRKSSYLSGLVQPVIAFTDNIAYVLVCVLGGLFAIRGEISVGMVIEVILYAKMFAGPLESIASGMSTVQYTLVCASRVYKLLDSEEMTEPEERLEPVGEGDVELTDVCFSYDKDKPLIKNLNVKVKAGQKVAIVGPTGGGKTTIVNLLMRFYDIDSGTITIDDTDIYKMDRARLRSEFAMVLQDTWLFNGTVFQNIAYGKEGATLEEVKESARKARIDGFIEALPDGYDTVINEESTNISGGQKQLLTIARSFLADRKMLILDEATSNVDTRTELLIQKSMDELLEGRTSFVIAHRLSTIVNADVILVVNDGEIVEQGTHSELMSRDSFYKKIYRSQYDVLA